MPAKTEWKRLARMVSPVTVTAATAAPAAGNGVTRLVSRACARTCDRHIDLTVCSVCATESYIIFFPAFAFPNLARGPPKRARDRLYSSTEGLGAQDPLSRRVM